MDEDDLVVIHPCGQCGGGYPPRAAVGFSRGPAGLPGRRATAAMDFQQLLSGLSGLADEHRRLEQERNELSEEVSRLRKKLQSSQRQLERARTQEALPGEVQSANGDQGEADPQCITAPAELEMHRLVQNARFLEIFGLSVSQQHDYRITAESLRQLLIKRGLTLRQDTFLDSAIQELARVSPHNGPPPGRPPKLFRGASLSAMLQRSPTITKEAKSSIGFEAFVAAILLPDLPKLVEPRLSHGVEKMQEALLKQDVDEVIAKLSRQRARMSTDVDPHKMKPTATQAWTKRFVAALNVVVSLTVLASIVCLGLSTETDPDWAGWLALEVSFAVIFVADSVLRIIIDGSSVFWCGQDRYLNWLDVLISAIAVADVCLNIVIQEADSLDYGRLALLTRTFRIMRLGRILKIVRSPLIRELYNMLLGFLLGSPALFWVSIILCVVVALLAMGLRIAVGPRPGDNVLVERCGPGDHPHFLVETDPECARHMLYAEEYCGSLGKCMFTVFRCLIGDCTSSGGQSLASHLSVGYGAKFDFVYLTGMIVVIFGLFNVITAIFVEATMSGLKYNDSKQKLRSMYEHQYVNRKLRELVRRIQVVSKSVQQVNIDLTGTNSARSLINAVRFRQDLSEDVTEDPESVANISLTEEEFFAVIEDGVVRQILLQLDIEVDGASKDTLFEIMGSDYHGTVGITEMLDTLMKLRGGPMKIDMIAPSVAIRRMQRELRRLGASSVAVADPADGSANPKGLQDDKIRRRASWA